MSYSRDFKYAIGWNRFSLDVVGAWPRRHAGIFHRERSLLSALGILVLIFLPQSISVIVHWENMDAVIECLSVNCPVFLALAKLLFFRYRRKEIRMCIDFMSDQWTISRASEEREVMMSAARTSRLISIGSGVITNALFMAFIFYQLYVGTEIKKLDPTQSVALLYPGWVPFDTRKIEYFIPMWIAQCITTFLSMTIYAVFDCMISTIILHICGQLSVLKLALSGIADSEDPRHPEKFNEKLAVIVKHHEQLNGLVAVIENSFNSILLPQMLVCTMTFCFQGFAVFTNLLDPNAGKISFFQMAFPITFVFYTVLHLFIYCYVGDELLMKSSSLSYSAYQSQWYNLSALEARSLLVVGFQSFRPLQITAGKFCPFSRNLFIKVLKTSMGYLSMLLTVKQRMSN
ncbi:odorant receptor 22c-like [Fopius arisanus]|uniref:Odorant receptor n=1 Tax=Fopius arisanus TaxID=64838 RepID=A0A9R1T1M5_9HYME|nr:PREDICTED: odorant receptor 22c-like [Fopius arisanus]